MPIATQTQNMTDVPPVNLNQAPAPSSNNSPFGGFKLVQCDGPDLSGMIQHLQPGQAVTINFNGEDITLTKSTTVVQDSHGNVYRPCNFAGLMVQAQFLINTMLVLGVIAALGGFAYAGYLYITGTQGNLKKAYSIFPKVFWGFVIMLTGWFIVHQILIWLTPAGSAYLQ